MDRRKRLSHILILIPVLSSAQAPILRDYQVHQTPPVRVNNSARLAGLIRAGKLYLTLQDAIALAIENNLDLEVARYEPLLAASALTRQQAGGPIRGVPSGSAQIAAVDNGLGAVGSIQASGLASFGNGGGAGGNGNTTVQQVGQITPNLDPNLQYTMSFSHQTQPFANSIGVGTYALVQAKHTYSTVFTEGLISGGTFQITDYEQYLHENSPGDVNNPEVGPYLAVYLRHQLLQGLGIKLNDRYIRIAKLNVEGARETFRSQVVDVVTSVINLYWDLASADDELKARAQALEIAQKFYEDTRAQIQIGAVARVELPRAESEAAGSRQDLLIAQASVRQLETRLKEALSRSEDPALDEAAIVPLDHIDIPATDDLPALRQLVAMAMEKRPDVAAAKIRDQTQEIGALGTINPLLPSLAVTAQAQDRGLAGAYQPSSGVPVNNYFTGGYGTALGQIFRRDFPSEALSLSFSAPFNNRAAQADYGIDQLQLRQSAVGGQRDLNAIVVAISNQLIGLRQARAKYSSAVDTRELDDQLLKAEQQKFAFGKSSIGNVIIAQRALVAAQTSEINARTAYAHARVSLDQVIGATLETNHVALDDALNGRMPPGRSQTH
ncbi:MAG: TolC family protein [Bryobacteraceae bacterium]|jgi:outer membrane protein TolC